VLSALALVVPLGLAASVSPILLTEQTVLVASPNGRRKGTAFATGAVLVLLVVTVVVALLGRSVRLPSEPRLDARLDLVLGAAVLGLAAVVARWRPGRSASPGSAAAPPAARRSRTPGPSRASRGSLGPLAAFGFGVFSMVTDFTTLAIVVVAARDIAAASWGTAVTLVAVLLLVALASAPAWAPVVVSVLPSPSARRALSAVSTFFDRQGRRLAVVVLDLVGVVLVVRGVLRLVGL
jgi:hypothetical protein